MTTAQTKNGTPPIDAAFEPVKELNEQFLAAARKAGNLYVDSYEKAVDRAIELERRLGGMTQQEWLKRPDRGPGRLRPRADRVLHHRGAQPAQVGLSGSRVRAPVGSHRRSSP